MAGYWPMTGCLLVHISNRFLDLEPVVSAAAVAGKWSAAKLVYFPGPKAGPGSAASAWIALSHDPAAIAVLKAHDHLWQPLPAYPRFTPWSDDYSTILPLVKAFH